MEQPWDTATRTWRDVDLPRYNRPELNEQSPESALPMTANPAPGKRALVTGGTGFVGSHVVRALIAAGHSVRVLHRASSKLDALADLTYETALGDITDADSLRRACEGISL